MPGQSPDLPEVFDYLRDELNYQVIIQPDYLFLVPTRKATQIAILEPILFSGELERNENVILNQIELVLGLRSRELGKAVSSTIGQSYVVVSSCIRLLDRSLAAIELDSYVGLEIHKATQASANLLLDGIHLDQPNTNCERTVYRRITQWVRDVAPTALSTKTLDRFAQILNHE